MGSPAPSLPRTAQLPVKTRSRDGRKRTTVMKTCSGCDPVTPRALHHRPSHNSHTLDSAFSECLGKKKNYSNNRTEPNSPPGSDPRVSEILGNIFFELHLFFFPPQTHNFKHMPYLLISDYLKFAIFFSSFFLSQLQHTKQLYFSYWQS